MFEKNLYGYVTINDYLRQPSQSHRTFPVKIACSEKKLASTAFHLQVY